jgi:hypothetical protein
MRQYLMRLRAERQQQAHARSLVATSPGDWLAVSNCAHEAELVTRVVQALNVLERDEGEFVDAFLKE